MNLQACTGMSNRRIQLAIRSIIYRTHFSHEVYDRSWVHSHLYHQGLHHLQYNNHRYQQTDRKDIYIFFWALFISRTNTTKSTFRQTSLSKIRRFLTFRQLFNFDNNDTFYVKLCILFSRFNKIIVFLQNQLNNKRLWYKKKLSEKYSWKIEKR